MMKLMVRALAALGLLIVIVSTTPVVLWWTDVLAENWGNEQGETLIVLGGDLAGPDLIGLSSYWRSYYAVLKWREHHYPDIVITGRAAALQMRDYMVSQGVPAAIIRVENAAVSTHENALFVTAMLKNEPGHKVLLTSDFHSRRALGAFHKAGLDVSVIPIPDARKRFVSIEQRWLILCEVAQETAKTVYYRLRGWA